MMVLYSYEIIMHNDTANIAFYFVNQFCGGMMQIFVFYKNV